jgi:hypothetical protein
VTAGAWLSAQLDLLRDAHRRGDPVAAHLLRGTGVAGGTAEEALAAVLEADTARQVIANDHRYPDWATAVAHSDDVVDLRFEAAADAIQWGGLDALRELLDATPELVRALVDGTDDDGVPLWTAITFGYTEAAEALVRCGARVDSLVLSAALGDLDAVRRHFEPGAAADPPVDHAIVEAALHGRRDVVAFLLGREPDLSFREPRFGATAQGAARYAGDPGVVELLEGAPH